MFSNKHNNWTAVYKLTQTRSPRPRKRHCFMSCLPGALPFSQRLSLSLKVQPVGCFLQPSLLVIYKTPVRHREQLGNPGKPEKKIISEPEKEETIKSLSPPLSPLSPSSLSPPRNFIEHLLWARPWEHRWGFCPHGTSSFVSTLMVSDGFRS